MLPTGTKLAFSSLETPEVLTAPLALKIVEGTQFTVSRDPATEVLEFNIPPAQSFKSGEGTWSVPAALTQSNIDAQIPNAPQD